MELIDDRTYLEPPKIKKEYVYKCDICDEEIFEGDSYYEIDGLIYCPDCMEMHFKLTAIRTDMDGCLSDLEHEDITE